MTGGPSFTVSPFQGDWAGGGKGFAGFEFSTINKHQKDYGWVRLQYTAAGKNGSVEVIDWAYDNTGAAILAGQEATAGDQVAPSPEPSTTALMLLAAGAAGVGVLRRRRNSL